MMKNCKKIVGIFCFQKNLDLILDENKNNNMQKLINLLLIQFQMMKQLNNNNYLILMLYLNQHKIKYFYFDQKYIHLKYNY